MIQIITMLDQLGFDKYLPNLFLLSSDSPRNITDFSTRVYVCQNIVYEKNVN